MGNFEELHQLEDTAEKIELLRAQRTEEVVKALLAGHSQRSVASSAKIAVNTVRDIMKERGIVHAGERYSIEKKAS
jgi:DNA-binding NarL/FixJ family response regulator